MFRHKKSQKDQPRKKRNAWRRNFECLESRLLLTNYTNVTIDDQQMNSLLAGIEGVVGLGDRQASTGQFSEPIRPFRGNDSNQLTPGGMAPIGRTIDNDLGNPVRDFFGTQPPIERTSNALIVRLNDEPSIVDVDGGLVDLDIDEIRFEVHFRSEYAFNLVDLEFGSPGHAIGIGFSNSVNTNLTAVVDVEFTFGIYLDPNLNFEQATFVRGFRSEVSIQATAIYDPFTLGIGVLEASVPDVTIDASLEMVVGNLAPNPLREWLLTDINTLSVDVLTETLIDTNHVNAQFEVTASVGDWVVAGSPVLQMVGSMIGIEPAVTVNADFTELLLFNRISLEDIVAGQEQFGAWLTGLMETDLFEVDIPFTSNSSLGSVYDAGAAYGSFTSTLRDSDGSPSFDDVQSFPYTGANGIGYDPATDRLSFFILRHLPSQRTESRASRLFVDQLLGIDSDERSQIDADGNIRYLVQVDLSDESVPMEQRMLLSNLRLDGEVSPSLPSVAGDAAYGGLGIQYTDATLTGQYTYQVDIGDANPAVDSLSLSELIRRLNSPATLLSSPTTYAGTSELRMTGLSVRDSLFTFASNAATIIASVPDLVGGAMDVVLENAPELSGFANLTFESVTESLTEAILGTEDWASMGDDAVATVGQTVENFVSIRQQRIVDAIDEGVTDLNRAEDASRLILQDLPGFLSNLVVASSQGFITFGSNIAYHLQSGFEIFFDARASAVQNMDFGIGFESLEDYTGDPLIGGTNDFVGARASATAESSVALFVGLELDTSNPNDPIPYVKDSTKLTTNVYVAANGAGVPLAMDGAVGSVGARFTDGRLVFAQNLAVPDPAAPSKFIVRVPVGHGRVRLDNFGAFQPTLNSVGRLQVDFDVIPDSSGAATPDRFTFRIGNLSNPLQSTTLLSSPSFPDLRAALDLPNQLQSVPPSLDELFGKIELELGKQVFGQNFPLIGTALDGPANFIRKLRTQLNTAFNAITTFDVGSIETAIESALSTLIGRVGDFVHVNIASPTEIRFTLAFDGAPINEQVSTNTNLGLPALGVSLDANLSVVGTYEMALTFVVSVLDGVYIDTSNERIQVALDVDLAATAQGRLGFIEVTAATIPPDPKDPGCGAFHAEFHVGLKDPSGDNKLTINELAAGAFIDKAATGLRGCSDLSFDIQATATEWLPALVTTLDIDWSFDGSDLEGSVPHVTFGNVGLRLGDFLTKTLTPFLTKIEAILDPIEPALNVLTDLIPVLDTLLDDPVSLLDLAKVFVDLYPLDDDLHDRLNRLILFIGILDSVNDLANAVVQDSATSSILQIGNLSFGGTQTPQFDARLEKLAESVLNEAGARNDLLDQLADPLAAPHLSAGLTTTPGEFHFPIFENPVSVFEWLLGFGQAEIVTWALPSVQLNIPIELAFPIIPGVLKAGLFGSIEASVGLTVGIDTYGFSKFAKSGQVGDLLAGFYVSDTENADGTGRDIPEVPVTGKVTAGLGLGFDLGGFGLSATVGGGIVANLNLDLIDHNGDGKLRGDEFSSPDGCLAIEGGVAVQLEATATAGPLHWDLPFARQQLGNFNTIVQCPSFNRDNGPPAVIASLNASTGVLTLLVGDQADQRNVGRKVEDEVYAVSQAGGFVTVFAFGALQTFSAARVTSIFANAGSGNDRIILDSTVTKPARLEGGEGDDLLIGGTGLDSLDGGLGNDELHGNVGADTIVGGDGDDEIYGDEGFDTIDGNDGDDEIHGGDDGDIINAGEGLNLVYGDGGDDTITGGSLRDVIYGGEGDDDIFGLGGRNVLMGDSGIDEIFGGQLADLIDGGNDGDFLYGMGGDDSIYGGQGDDLIDSASGDDYVDGGSENDTIDGGNGVDIIHGGAGDDTIDGGADDDQLFGEAGDDEIFGRNGVDTISGGDDSDTIHGGSDNDIIHGDAGNDTLEGGVGDDQLFGDSGDDTIYGNIQSLRADDTTVPGFTDNDLIYGGSNRDEIAGGAGRDTIYGEEGDDVLQGNEDVDTIDGGGDNDTIYGHDAINYQRGGTDGPDDILGGLGEDVIYGGPADDLIRGGKGNDTIFGEDGRDAIFGDEGNDTLDGGPQSDEIDGGVGNDIILGAGDADILYGNDGFDTMEGNDGDDTIRGNNQADLIYGDDGDDNIAGNSGNDTIRGGNGDDTIRGNQGDDLLLGFSGVDTISGDEGNDVIYGNNGNDILHGNVGNDRLYGELGDDVLFGDDGNDVLEGGAGGDTLSGNNGDDALYGDGGIDELSGGNGNDILIAGNGIGDFLRGDAGNDTIVGSDDGSNDPNAKDTTYFGDRIEGGDGDDTIDGLGGSDIINGGSGRDRINGGTHNDIITGGPDVVAGLLRDDDEIDGGDGDDSIQGGDGDDIIRGGSGLNTINGGLGTNTIDSNGHAPVPIFAMSLGPERRGKWAELSGSATQNGLSNVGGFEEAAYATDFGVYVAWVDWRNGNYEIYVAFHPNGVGDWISLVGFDGNGSASGGGISNDREQSRRPTLFKPKNSESLVVAWTSIKDDGTSTIEVAREETNWSRVINPAQTGFADNAILVQYSEESGLLAWLDTSSGFQRANVTQFVYEPSCFVGFIGGGEVGGAPPNVDIRQLDIDATEFRAAIVTSYGDSLDHDIQVVVNRSTNLLDETGLCPGVPNANVQVLTPKQWQTIHTETTGDTSQPTVGVQLIALTSQGQNEVELDTDVLVAWERTSDHENQVDGIVINIPMSGPISQPSQLVPQYGSDSLPRLQADSVSDTVGYTALPDLDASYYGTFLAWMDDGTFADGGRSSIYILSRYRDTTPGPYVMREFEPLDASGRGLSRTGGSLQSLSIALDENGFASTFPYIVWTEEATIASDAMPESPMEGVYLRVTQPGLALVDDSSTAGKFQKQETNVLANDLNLFGEIQGRVTHFDGRALGLLGSDEYFSLLGAKVQVKANGSVSYDPRGVAAFRSLRRGQSLSESFVYRVNNFIYDAEALVTFTVVGDNRWNNFRNRLDVDDDGDVSPLDVLTLVNDINVFGVRELPFNPPFGTLVRFLDVDDDGTVSPLDVLLVINYLNSRGFGAAEGESVIESLRGPVENNFDDNPKELEDVLGYMPDELVGDIAKRTKNRMSRSNS